jgi:cyclase
MIKLSLSLILCSFLASAGEPVWDANKVELRGEKLADGVFAIYPTHSAELNASGGAAATRIRS